MVKSDTCSGRKIAKVMREYHAGTLKDSHGKTVTNPSQAAAIGYSEARAKCHAPLKPKPVSHVAKKGKK